MLLDASEMLVDRPIIFGELTRFQKRLALGIRHVRSIAYMHMTKCRRSCVVIIWSSL
jgi:hypothetical protein